MLAFCESIKFLWRNLVKKMNARKIDLIPEMTPETRLLMMKH